MTFGLLLALISTADAGVFQGNPSVTITSTSTNDVLLWSLDLERCTGGIESLPLRAWVDAQTGLTLTLPEGDFCEVTAILHGPPSAVFLFTAPSDELDVFTPTTNEATLELDELNSTLNLLQN